MRENIKKKFQDVKLPLVDEVIELDKANRAAMTEADGLRNKRKVLSKQIGGLMAKGQKDEAEAVKAQVAEIADQLTALEAKEEEYAAEIRKRMMVIPQIIDASVPIGKDDSENVQNEVFGEPVVPDYEIPYHVDIMESLNGIDLDSARRTSGNGFYYLKGDCLLVVGDDDMIKLHFHTNEPWRILEYCATLGEIYDIVIEDMDRQSRGLVG